MDTRIINTNIDWKTIKNECRTTMNKDGTDIEPTEEFKKKLLISEHSPIRLGTILFAWDSIKSWIAVHFSRHWLGWGKRISTQRPDRTGVDRDKAPQDTLVQMHVDANIQALINVGKVRLCYQASKETREKMEDLKVTIHNEVDEYVSNVLVPNCIYRGGCSEFHCCGLYPKFLKWCRKVKNIEDSELFNIQKRYDLYNEWFYEGRE